MKKTLLTAIVFLAIPVSVFASTLTSARTLVVSEPSDGNTYLSGTDITITAPQDGDVLALGGTITSSAPVKGDVLFVGGTAQVHKEVLGDVRAVAGTITITAPVGGDLALAGGTIVASTSPKDTQVAGGSVTLSGGSRGNVTVYASDVSIQGVYQGDVTLTASDNISLLPGTHITGKLLYNAPQQIIIPEGVVIDGGVTYTGSSSYLPTNEQAKTFAVAGASILLLVHIIALILLAGLFAGFFPLLTEKVVERSVGRNTSSFVLMVLLGFAILIATPVLILLLLLSFVGIGVGVLLIPLYLLFLLVAYVYAGILTGSLLSKAVLKREIVTWKEGLVGMLVFYLVGMVPGIGGFAQGVLFLVCLGALTSITFSFAFRKEEPHLFD
jgi:cytoskeletal protein CcmA (bactofilin family)